MTTFNLLRPEEVIENWPTLSQLLEPAVAQCNGEMEVDDVLNAILNGRTFLFALIEDETITFAITADFKVYPRKTVMFVGFAGGKHGAQYAEEIWATLARFGAKAGAVSMQAFCENPAMVRYHQRFTGAQRKYFVVEKLL